MYEPKPPNFIFATRLHQTHRPQNCFRGSHVFTFSSNNFVNFLLSSFYDLKACFYTSTFYITFLQLVQINLVLNPHAGFQRQVLFFFYWKFIFPPLYLFRGFWHNFLFAHRIQRCISERTIFHSFRGDFRDVYPNSHFFKINSVWICISEQTYFLILSFSDIIYRTSPNSVSFQTSNTSKPRTLKNLQISTFPNFISKHFHKSFLLIAKDSNPFQHI